jgi:hypothetical protein
LIGILFYFFLTNFSNSFGEFFDPYLVFLFVLGVPFLSSIKV